MRQKALAIEHISKICHVSSITVLRWLQQQNLKPIKIPGDQPKVWRSDLIKFLDSIHEPVPKELVLIDTLNIVVMVYDTDLRKLILKELKDLLPNAHTTAPGNAFEAGLSTHELNPHILILDFDTPGIDGCSVTRALKNSKRFQCTRIISIGSKEMGQYRKDIIESGSDDFFSKPIKINPFKDSIAYQVNELV